MAQKIKSGDTVLAMTGKDKGKSGLVQRVLTKKRRGQDQPFVLVEGVNIVKRHTKGNEEAGKEGGILEKSMPIHLSNVSLRDPSTGKAGRVGFKTLEDGHKVRVFKKSGEVVDVK